MPNQPMKPTAPLRDNFSVFATTPCRGLSLSRDRLLFAAKDPARGTDAELRAAFEDYGSYFGTYTIDQTRQTVTHQVRGAWYPNWIGHDQVRHFKFDGSRLLLSTPPLIWDGQSFEHVLTWERIS
jgi:hypothetical protein